MPAPLLTLTSPPGFKRTSFSCVPHPHAHREHLENLKSYLSFFFYSTLIDFQFRGEISQLAKPTDLPSPYQRFTKPRTFVILLFNLCQINIAHLRLHTQDPKGQPRLKSRSAFETIAWPAIRIKVRLKTFYINRFCTCMNLWSQGHFIVLETKCFVF